MPCTYDPGPEDYLRTERQRNAKLVTDLDKLTRENDKLREAVLTLINERDYVPDADVLVIIEQDQIAHRKEDLTRLEAVFRLSKDALLLGKVLLADPAEPLKPQLGFDPDDF